MNRSNAIVFEPVQGIESDSQAVLILASSLQDAQLISVTLKSEHIQSHCVNNIDILCEKVKDDAGVLLIAEEMLDEYALDCLNEYLRNQEAWSDLPVIIITSNGEMTLSGYRLMKSFLPNGNISLLERPFRRITLISALQVALRARARQYQIRDLLKKQIEATQMREQFISIASHELKTPLTSLKLQAQMNQRMLQKNPTFHSPERVRRLVDTTNKQVDRLARLVEDMLDVSRISSGKMGTQKTKINLAELILEVVDGMMPEIAAAHCDVNLDLYPEAVGIWDHYRIEQVITNLITNVMRYAPAKPFWISLRKEADFAVLSVQDEGMGIAPQNLDRIFNRFERAVSCENISGLGLGLYICREIAESHGGKIKVESELGQGATFTLRLPLEEVKIMNHGISLGTHTLGVR